MTPGNMVSWGLMASTGSPWYPTAGRASAGVARLQRLLVASLAEVVSAGVADDGPLATVSICASKYSLGEHTPMTLSGPMILINLSVTEPLELP